MMGLIATNLEAPNIKGAAGILLIVAAVSVVVLRSRKG